MRVQSFWTEIKRTDLRNVLEEGLATFGCNQDVWDKKKGRGKVQTRLFERESLSHWDKLEKRVLIKKLFTPIPVLMLILPAAALAIVFK